MFSRMRTRPSAVFSSLRTALDSKGDRYWRATMPIIEKAKLAVVAVLFLTSATASYGQGRWERLGTAHVDGNRDHDNITVGMRDGRFRAIQLRVRGGAVEFERVVVHYGDGEPEEVAVRERIPDRGMTRAIDLRGNRRLIRSVELWYARGGWRQRPEVQLYGRR